MNQSSLSLIKMCENPLMPKTDYKNITARCFINAPWYDLKNRYLELFLHHGIQPEIGLEGLCLYNESPHEFSRIAVALNEADLSCTLHAPFFDLAPGALDPEILRVSRSKLKKAAKLIQVFKPLSIVCHLGFEENKQGYKRKEWLKIALATWNELEEVAAANGCLLMLENTYETSPDIHETLLSQLNPATSGFCMDTGHLMSFAKTSWKDWLPRLSPWLGQLHLHDNNGASNEHLGLGQGSFDFVELFQFLSASALRPLITLEPHSEKDLWHSLEYLKNTRLLDTF